MTVLVDARVADALRALDEACRACREADAARLRLPWRIRGEPGPETTACRRAYLALIAADAALVDALGGVDAAKGGAR